MALPNTTSSGEVGTAVTPDSESEIIKEPHDHDVLCGRGGSINSWKGNERFRTLVEKRKRVYLTARFKREKRLIASSIVQEIQALDPPGRFLSRNAKKGTWFVIDDDKARDKVSQALRENAPSIRAEIEIEVNEQRAEIQRSQHDPHGPPPPNAPPNPYYPQGWGYFSYYGYAQQSSHPNGPGPMPPPPPHYHPGYNNGQWNNSGGNGSPHSASPPPPPSEQPTQPQEQPQQPSFNFSFSPKPTSKAQQQREQDQQHNMHQEQPLPMHPPQPQVQAVHRVAPPPQDDDEKSVLDATVELMSSVASWTKGAFSIGGGMSVAPYDDPQENASVASKPIKYVHQPEDSQSVSSRGARSVRFQDERSISGRALEPRKPGKPPRIMHSSQINYPRRPKRNSIGGAAQPNGRPPNNGVMAPVSSVHLNDHNDGMISLITTEGMNSIMEDGPLMMDEYDHHHQMEKNHPNEEFKDSEPDTEPLALNQRPKVASRQRSRDSLGDDASASNSMLAAVANQIVMGMGSWDAGTIACGPENGPGVPKEINQGSEKMAVEIEGQEVLLVDMMDPQQDLGGDNSVLEDRMPPHDKEQDWPSRVGSCHSFFNDSLAGASLFSLGNTSRGDASRGDGLSLASSMDMDVSSGTDPFSCADSVGGASLCRVFDAEAITRDAMPNSMPSPNMHNRVLAQMPSWERSLRNKSPFSEGADDHEQDQCSLMTKSSEKLMGGSISTIGSMENNDKNQQNGAMAWESHNKE